MMEPSKVVIVVEVAVVAQNTTQNVLEETVEDKMVVLELLRAMVAVILKMATAGKTDVTKIGDTRTTTIKAVI